MCHVHNTLVSTVLYMGLTYSLSYVICSRPVVYPMPIIDNLRKTREIGNLKIIRFISKQLKELDFDMICSESLKYSDTPLKMN